MEHELNERDRRSVERGTEQIMTAVELMLQKHKNDCPVAIIQEQHNRMFKEMFNGDDGKHGFFAEMRGFVVAWNTRTVEDDKRKKRRWVAAAVIVPVLCVIFAEPAQVGWRKIEALSDLAAQAPDIIKLTEDWKKFYANPPVHQMDQAPIVTPPEAQPFPKKQIHPMKPKTSFFEYGPKGVGLLQKPTLQTTTEKENW